MITVRFLPVLVLLTACSSGAPTVYGQMAPGAPMPPPRAPVFNPTLDAPITTGQPGFIGPPANIPRGESKRVLPPTREPGLWASDAPEASLGGKATLFGVELPLPDNPSSYELLTAAECAKGMANLAKTTVGLKAVNKLLWPQTKCLAAKLYKMCSATSLEEYTNNETSWTVFSKEKERKLQSVFDVASAFEREACNKVEVPGDMVSDLKDGWAKSVEAMRAEMRAKKGGGNGNTFKH